MNEKPKFYPTYSLNYNGSGVIVHGGGDMAFVVLLHDNEAHRSSSLTLSVSPDNLYDEKGRLLLSALSSCLTIMADARSKIYTLEDIPF
jgi:hypothetical protein